MAKIKPFRAVRPCREYAQKVAALPYDAISFNEAFKVAKNNQYSFLHVDRAEIDLDHSINPYDNTVYEKARENLDKMISNGVLVEENNACMYIYRQIMDGRVQTGLVTCTSIDDYINNNIKKHENTREEKEKDRFKHIEYCSAHTGPIFMAYKNNDTVAEIIEKETKNKPEYDFTTQDGITQRIWVIDNPNIISHLTQLFAGIDSLYIADGHHRAAAAVKVGLKCRKQNPNYSGDEEFNYFMSVLFPGNELMISEYNRVVKGIKGITKNRFINETQKAFYIMPCDKNIKFKPAKRHTFGMFLEDEWYMLKAKEGTFNTKDPVLRLDVSILQNNLLSKVLGINDPRTDERIDFVGGLTGIEELQKTERNPFQLAFAMYPTSIDELIEIADSGRLMPPKSTYFEPKLLSGLFIHKF